MNKDYILKFGKFNGEPLDKIPLKYLDWLVGKDWLNNETRHVITGYLIQPVIKRELESELDKQSEQREY